MNRVSVNPALVYSKNSELKKPSISSMDINKNPNEIKNLGDESNKKLEISISDKSKELKEKLSSTEKAIKIHEKKFGKLEKPGIYFVSGFDWFGAGSIKGNYDGIKDMADAIPGAKHYSWDEQDLIIEDIKKRKPDQPIVIIGHSFGGDSAVEIAQELNSIENGFRKIDLLVTLDSVGYDNDKIPQNVGKNLNYLAQGPYEFLNDGPNIALNYKRTAVENYLRHEKHADLDDSTDIQIEILDQIEKAVS